MIKQVISVCMATYNGSFFIKQQLDSILSQLGPNDELVISDDHSSDNTIDIINQYGDPRIHVYYNQLGKGYTSNFQNALNHANGDFIFLCDQDDIWSHNKVAVSMSYLQKYDFVVSDARLINSLGDELSDSFYVKRRPYKSIIGNIIKFGYLGCCMAFNRKILDKALPFPNNHTLCTHDNWLFMVSIMYYRVKILDDQLIFYRRHGNNVSSGGLTSSTSLVFKIKYRLYLMYNLLVRAF